MLDWAGVKSQVSGAAVTEMHVLVVCSSVYVQVSDAAATKVQVLTLMMTQSITVEARDEQPIPPVHEVPTMTVHVLAESSHPPMVAGRAVQPKPVVSLQYGPTLVQRDELVGTDGQGAGLVPMATLVHASDWMLSHPAPRVQPAPPEPEQLAGTWLVQAGLVVAGAGQGVMLVSVPVLMHVLTAELSHAATAHPAFELVQCSATAACAIVQSVWLAS